MEEKQENIIYMAKYLVIASIKFNPGIFIFSNETKEKQEALFDAIKETGHLPEDNGSASIASAYKATIEERYEAKIQIKTPIITNIN